MVRLSFNRELEISQTSTSTRTWRVRDEWAWNVIIQSLCGKCKTDGDFWIFLFIWYVSLINPEKQFRCCHYTWCNTETMNGLSKARVSGGWCWDRVHVPQYGPEHVIFLLSFWVLWLQPCAATPSSKNSFNIIITFVKTKEKNTTTKKKHLIYYIWKLNFDYLDVQQIQPKINCKGLSMRPITPRAPGDARTRFQTNIKLIIPLMQQCHSTVTY